MTDETIFNAYEGYQLQVTARNMDKEFIKAIGKAIMEYKTYNILNETWYRASFSFRKHDNSVDVCDVQINFIHNIEK